MTAPLDPSIIRGTGPILPPAAQAAIKAATGEVAAHQAHILAPDAPLDPSENPTTLALGSLGHGVVKAQAASTDLLPVHVSADLGDGKNITAEDMNRFNLMQQIYQSSVSASTSAAHGTDHDITSKATAVQKKPEPPKKHGGFFSKLMDFVKQILPVLTIVAMFVPGLQVVALALQVAQLAMKAQQLVEAIKSGNLTAILSSAASIAATFTGAGGVLGQVAQYGAIGAKVLQGAQEGGLAGALGGLGGLFGGDVGAALTTAGSAISAIQKGDVTALLGAVGAGADRAGFFDADTMKAINGALGTADAAVKGDAGSLLKSVGSLSGSSTLGNVGDLVKTFQSGDLAGTFSSLKDLGVGNDAIDAALAQASKAGDFLKAAETGDFSGMMSATGNSLDASTVSALKTAIQGEASAQLSSTLGF